MALERVLYADELYTLQIWIPGSSVHRPEMEPDVPWQIVHQKEGFGDYFLV